LVQEVVLDLAKLPRLLAASFKLIQAKPYNVAPATKNRIYVEWVKMTAILVGSF
jgi:hypothetical protein